MPRFEVISEFSPAGDQPKAIEALAEGVERGDRFQTLLGITGSGKSATIAWTIEKVQKPTLVLAPNKALAAQLANEFRQLFPNNRVEYFVSYYDYYQPEAYIPQTDTYIEKDATVNDEIDRLRHSCNGRSPGPGRRDHRRLRVGDLRSRVLLSNTRVNSSVWFRGVEYPMAEAIKASRRHPVRTQRGEPDPWQVPGSRRHPRSLPLLRGDHHPGPVLGRRGGTDRPSSTRSLAKSSRK